MSNFEETAGELQHKCCINFDVGMYTIKAEKALLFTDTRLPRNMARVNKVAPHKMNERTKLI